MKTLIAGAAGALLLLSIPAAAQNPKAERDHRRQG